MKIKFILKQALLIILMILQIYVIIANIPLILGKKKIVDVHKTYNYAVIFLPNDEKVDGELDYYYDLENGIMTISISGVEYRTSSDRVVFIDKKE